MRKIWNFLFESDRHINEYRGVDQRDALTEAYFLSRTGVTLGAREAARRSEPKTGELGLGSY
jgi:hypothetical protein